MHRGSLKLCAALRSKDGVDVRMLGVEATFEVLNVLEYSSARGRMSVIARARPCLDTLSESVADRICI